MDTKTHIQARKVCLWGVFGFWAAICGAATYSGGSGTYADPYQITTKANLLTLAATTADYNKYFILTTDIDLTGEVFTAAIIAPDMTEDDTFQSTPFTGRFDGNCHTIFNLNITTTSGYYVGLFGYISTNGRVCNVVLENVNITGKCYVGGVAGFNYCGTIVSCSATGNISGTSYAGGLVGLNSTGTITVSYATDAVNGTFGVGGLVGYNYCGTVSQCYSTGAVSGTSNTGGLIGMSSSGSVSDCFWDIETSGQTTSAGGAGQTTAGMKTLSTFTGAGWDFWPVSVDGDMQDWVLAEDGMEYPKFLWQCALNYSGGSGTAEDPYQLSCADDILYLSEAWWDLDNHFILTADIDMNGMIFSTAIISPDYVIHQVGIISESSARLTGTFDGNGHKITNFIINGGDGNYLGLFGDINTSGVVKNLGLENCTISGTSYSDYVGGLAGINYGYIYNCYSAGSVRGYYYVGGLVGYIVCSTIDHCYSTGPVNGTSYMGGLAGYSYYGHLDNCYSTSTVCGASSYIGGLIGYCRSGVVTDCYCTGPISGTSYVGGLIGCYYPGIASDYYTIGYYYPGTVMDCYSTGAVSGTSYVGGLVGFRFGGNISNCFWGIETSGQMISSGGTGKTTAEMKTLSTFTSAGWEFTTIWAICEGTNYPRLIWQIPDNDRVCPDGVNTEDLNYFVERWLLTNCTADNNYCGGADIDSSGAVNIADFAIFAEWWLYGIGG